MSSENINTDIAIIGGGLSGLSLSILLAKEGFEVTLFEKKDYPRHKVCGEYISLESWDFLERIGIPLNTLNLPIISEVYLSSHQGTSLKSALPLGGFGISRFTLEELLFQKAQQVGVKVLTKTSIVSYSDNAVETQLGVKHFANLVIASYGKKTNFNIQVKPSTGQKYFALKWHMNADIPKDRIHLHFFEKGYIGSSQIEEGKTNACLIAAQELLENSENNIEQFLHRYVFKNKEAKELFENATLLFERPLSIGNITFSHRYPSGSNLLLCGDAAGMVAPLNGNGMSMAFYSAFLLAEQIKKYRNTPESKTLISNEYEKIWKKKFRNRLLVGNLLQHASLNNFAIPTILKIGKTIPALLPPLIKLTHGKPF